MGLKKQLVLITSSVLLLLGQGFAENSAKNTARALFMSTAESKVSVPTEAQNRGSQAQQKVSNRQNVKRPQQAVAYGLQFQVFLVRDDKEIPVNPARHIFREGDRFKVQITTNTPGIIMVANRDPLGKETFLGSWPIERAFSKVMIPAEGYFEFYGPKGEDLLYVLFIPCKVEENTISAYKNYSVSRSIRVVADETTEKVRMKDDVYTKLPACKISPQEERFIYESKKQSEIKQASYSRAIRVSYDEGEKAGYVLYSSHERSEKGVNPRGIPVDMVIFSVIKFNYR